MTHGFSHSQIWLALDALAVQHGLTPSGLARTAGLDPTAFNKSKRVTSNGRPRWPSTESLAKVLAATDSTLDEFVQLISRTEASVPPAGRRTIPLIGFAQAGSGGFFDDGGFPVGGGWEEVGAPAIADEHAYALEISGESMLPVYRQGDIIVVSPAATVRRGDRVVAKTREGEVLVKELGRRSGGEAELISLNPAFVNRVLREEDLLWIARVIWARQ
ncbi:putative phage repressor [Tepidicaulis marinus]|uniref:Putative phage repressor n=1 Tax=Tepidicaulis marinus TaxID=1333998 RepID=A0A081BC02_9HYPH|nr:helix-turn-helix transcriptional regulator [Tepidicaulis marinus]GAK45570.1 putative phage repressor [Tepidicaulis marinus]